MNLLALALQLVCEPCVAVSQAGDLPAPAPPYWGLKATEAEKAWPLTKGEHIVVAIVDTGVDTHNQELSAQLWTNPNEIPDNDLDDDKNGYIDDVHGWDFATNSPSLTDHHGHGTHIAGIIHSLAPKARLMILKYYDPYGDPGKNLSNSVQALQYAARMKVQLINYSGGGLQKSRPEEAAIALAAEQNILLIAAAGNEHSDSDRIGFYPASYDLPNIISVAAASPDMDLVPSSNFGARTVDLAAPGQDILSTLPQHRQGPMTGTSQATAFVTGTAALILASRPSPVPFHRLIRILTETGLISPLLTRKTKSSSILNAYRSVTMKEFGLSAFGYAIDSTPDEELLSSN